MSEFLNKLCMAVEPIVGRDSVASAIGDQAQLVFEGRVHQRLHLAGCRRQLNIEQIIALASLEERTVSLEEPVSKDWLNMFFTLAQDAEDESARQLWARLLAIQLEEPSRILKRTLLAVYGMDSWEIDAFSEYCSFSFSLESGWRFIFDEELLRREIWGYVRGNDYTQHFISTGLIASETGIIRARSSRGLRIRYFDKVYELTCKEFSSGEGEVISSSEFGYRKFTIIGQQLALAMRPRVFNGYARNIVRTLRDETGICFELLSDEIK